MTVGAFVVAILALLVSLVSVGYTHRATKLQSAADRREREPQLVVTTNDRGEGTIFTYTVRNEGPQDLDSVVIRRPAVPDGIRFPIAVVGEGWADEIELRPLRLGEERRFNLSVGAAETLPAFRVRVECRAGSDTWALVKALDTPGRAPRPY